MTIAQLRTFARDNNLTASGRTKKDLVGGLVDQTVGARLNRAAIQHDELRDGLTPARVGAHTVDRNGDEGQKLTLGKLARAPRAKTSRAERVAPEEAMGRLQAAGSREDAAAILNGMTVTQLRTFAKDHDLTAVGSTKKSIVESLVDQTTGYKISSRTMQHQERDLPGVYGNSGPTQGKQQILPGERTGSTKNRAPARAWNPGTRIGDLAVASRGGVLTAYTVRQSVKNDMGSIRNVVADAAGVEHLLDDVNDRNVWTASADKVDVAAALKRGPWSTPDEAREALRDLLTK
ncbi:hypothetical protein [Frankia sp. AgB32]|uniref:hypothetical protein n=1 Tax=Frankia sp. AgB32 TaxID=631119 RepID=UPI0020109B44|nr:hypothetical protein [Frankia sp. AgB32]